MEYKKHTHREHIYELPDTYIGSIETIKEEHHVLKDTQIFFEMIEYILNMEIVGNTRSNVHCNVKCMSSILDL